MAVEAFQYFKELPDDLQDNIWGRVMNDFNRDHKKKYGYYFRNLPNIASQNRYLYYLDKCYIQPTINYYRNIRDYLQSLADQRKIALIFSHQYQEIWLSSGMSFSNHFFQDPRINISCVWDGDIDDPLYGDEDEYVPRWEVPPNQPEKELVFIWLHIQIGNYMEYAKFALNIDYDLIHNSE